jgi:hypothetical protein
MGVWTGFIWLTIGTNDSSYEHGDEPLGSMKGEELFEQLNDYQLLNKDCALWVNKGKFWT